VTVSNSAFGGSSGSGGPVLVSPDRLISFSTVPGTASAPNATAPVASKAPARFRFRINPDRLSIKNDKLERYVLTKAGYERQSWGNGLTVFSYGGSSGVFRPDVTVQEFLQRFPGGGFDIRKTTAWLRFKEFENFYQRTGSTNVFMYFPDYDHEWEGSLSGFTFERAAMKPFQIDYQFTFTGLPIDYPITSLDVGVSSADAKAVEKRQASSTGGLGDFNAPSGIAV
jgi:hypothetical protein